MPLTNPVPRPTRATTSAEWRGVIKRRQAEYRKAIADLKRAGAFFPGYKTASPEEKARMLRGQIKGYREQMARELKSLRSKFKEQKRLGNPAKSAAQYRLAEAVAHGRARSKTSMTKKAAQELISKTPPAKRSQFMKNAGKKSWHKTKKAAHKRLGLHKKRTRKNPEASAAQAYALTHGKQPGIEIEVDTPRHYHSVLAGMGKLEMIVFAGGPVRAIKFGKGTVLAMNERRTQLFIVGGDQSVNLRDFGITRSHETEILGEVREVVYFTEKLHLIKKDGGKGSYAHKFSSPLPVLVYDARNKLLSFAGGGYSIPAEGIDG